MADGFLHFISDTASTNRLLEEYAAEAQRLGGSLTSFTAVCADHQTAGRGMGSNQWFSEAGKNLLISIFFEQDLNASRQFLFNQYFAIETVNFLAQFLPEIQIKWPNDIYVHGHKLAGILIEHTLQGECLLHTIAGIGININQEAFPSDIPHPTSLFLETGECYDVEQMARRYHHHLHESFAAYDWSQDIAANTAYLSRLYRLGEWHRYAIQGREVTAMITGVDPYGRLMLQGKQGEPFVCGFKEIVFL